MTAIVLNTAAASQPVSLTDAKLHLRVTHTDDDTYITTLITHVTDVAEKAMNRALITSTWDYYLDDFPQKSPYLIELPKGYVSEVTSVKYIDTTNDYVTLSSSYYEADILSEPARIVLASGYSYPVVNKYLNAVKITFKAGYANAAAVPKSIIQVMYLHLSLLYDIRSPILTGTTIAEIPYSLQMLYNLNKVWTFY